MHVPLAQLYQMQMLTHGCQPGDSLIFHFSGAPPAACQSVSQHVFTDL